MRKLVIAEKPSVAGAIAEALGGGFTRQEGYLERDDVVITWAFGHIVRYADPEAYGEQYQGRWRMDVLPILPERFKLVPDPTSVKQLKIVMGLLKSPFDSVVNGCDSGREGEHIFRLIYAISGSRLPVERLWTASMNPEGILEAWQNLRPGSAYNNLAASAQARAEADWLVGMNLTRAFSVHHGSLLSCGRVQTPVLAMIVEREREIENFTPRDFWELRVDFDNPAGSYRGKWFRGDTSRFDALADARAVQQKVAGQTGTVVKVEQRQRRSAPPPLYDLTALQRDMNRQYGFTAQKTLSIAQALYEQHKVITYPRTDSRFLTRDMQPRLPALVGSLADRFPKEVERLNRVGRLEAAHVINDKKVTDHHAIIPTGKPPVGLNPDEQKVFDAIARRFLAVFYPPCVQDVTVVVTEVAGETFLTRGSVMVEPGWRELYSQWSAEDEGGSRKAKEKERADETEDDAAGDLPPLEEGSASRVVDTEIAAGQTKPPARYTEASILAAMEKAGRFVEAEDLREALKSRGLGTPATRAAILERLKEVGYIQVKGKRLVPTEKGRLFISAVPLPTLRSPEMTAQWEMRLTAIEEGAATYQDFIRDIRAFVTEAVSTVAASPRVEALRQGAAGSGSEALGTCPKCRSGAVRQRKGKDSAFYGCDRYPDCDFTLPGSRSGKNLTPAIVKELLSQGRTKSISGFKSSRTGATFSAQLALTADYRLEFIFPERGSGGGEHSAGEAGAADAAPEPVGTCPACRKPVVLRRFGGGAFYGCTGYPDCRFRISGEILSRPIAPAEVRMLLERGETDLLDGFAGKKGKFRARLVLKGTSVEFRFPERT